MITTREQLIDALHAASEVEHVLMCEYLFAAYSMKRSTDEGISAVDLERSRRWGMASTFIARQEMEHLGLVLNILSAIGAPPYLGRPNFPQKKGYYGKGNPIEVTLTKFDLPTIERFVVYEAPAPSPKGLLTASNDTFVPEDYKDLPSLRAALLARGRARISAAATRLQAPLYQMRTEANPFPFDSVPELYATISEGITYLSESPEEERELFSGNPEAQIYGGPDSPYEGDMDDLNQYGIDLMPVTGADSAQTAIAMILLQGEGSMAPPDYMQHTHWELFKKMRDEMGTLDAARNVAPNTLPDYPPDVDRAQVNLITNEQTAQVARLFNHTYETMLLMMLYLYGYPRKTKEESKGFTDAIFFPLMTMFVRQLAEVLTQLPAFTGGQGNSGPSFIHRYAEAADEIAGVVDEVGDDVAQAARNLDRDLLFRDWRARTWARKMLSRFVGEGIWKVFQEQLDSLVREFDALSIFHSTGHPRSVMEPMKLMRMDIRRLAFDWQTKWKEMGRPL
jgi:hypothetical protein